MLSRVTSFRFERLGLILVLAFLGLSPFYRPRICISAFRKNEVSPSPDQCAATPVEEKQAQDQGPRYDNPGEAETFWRLHLMDENGNIPAEGLVKAVDQMRQMQTSPRVAGINNGSWTWLGPGNIGGRVRSIVVKPSNPNVMFAGGVAGGIWTTTNGGASWSFVNDFLANLAVATIVIHPSNENILYAGTGEGYYNFDSIRGAGVFKSTDGGTTWNQLSSTNNSAFYSVNRLAISPDGNTILAATGNGIYRSTDAGASWTRTLTDTTTKDVNFDPTNNSKAVASGNYLRAWYSTDGGASWTAATGLPASSDWLARVEVAYAPSATTIVYAGLNRNSGELWKSVDGGQSYSLMNTGNNYMRSQGWYDNMVWVNPVDANFVVVGGADWWRSTNGGTTLTDIGGYAGGIHPDQHWMIQAPGFDGSSNKTVYVGNDGGIFKATDITTVSPSSGWQELNNNLGITQFYGAAGNASSGIIVGGTQDNGTLRYSGGTETWSAMFGGDGGFSASDPTDPNYFYGEYVYLMLHRSTNGGLSSNWIYSGLGDANSCANFIAPFILDPNNASRMLGGGCSLWRSDNVKAAVPAWSSIKAAISGNSPISAIAVAPGNSNIIWVGHNNGNVYMTTNGTVASPTWTQMDLNTPNLPNRTVTRITIDPNNSNIVYAIFGGFSSDNIYRTANAGLNWSDVTGSGGTGLPSVPVNSLVIHPSNSNWIYAGTEVGVFASQDSGATWTVPQDGPANVAVDELFWMNTTLVAATHGRGLFKTATTTPFRLTLPLIVR